MSVVQTRMIPTTHVMASRAGKEKETRYANAGKRSFAASNQRMQSRGERGGQEAQTLFFSRRLFSSHIRLCVSYKYAFFAAFMVERAGLVSWVWVFLYAQCD